MYTVIACIRRITVCLLLLSPSATLAQNDSTWTVDDLLLQESSGSFDISPDGDWVVWVKTKMDKKKGTRISNLVLRSLVDTTEIPLTRGNDVHSNPLWSPDGTKIAFTSSRKAADQKDSVAGSQLWMINARGGEPWAITRMQRSILSFDWRNDDTILYLAEEAPSRYEQKVKEAKDSSRIVEDAENKPPVRLFSFDLQKKQSSRVTDNEDWMRSLAVSPDGKWAVTTHQRSLRFSFDNEITPTTWLTNVETGSQTEIEAANRILVRNIVWALDSSGFYYTYEVTNHPKYYQATESRLKYYDLETETSLEVELDWDWGLGGGLDATSDGFVALLADGVRYHLARYVKQGLNWVRDDLTGTHVDNIWSLEVGPDGETLAYQYSTASTPTQWYAARLDEDRITGERKITKLNPGFEKKPIHRTEIVSWTGALDEEIEGVLYYPIGYEEGKRYPLMLSIHGGPTGTDTDSWRQSYATPLVLLAQRDAFILKVNYHGSGNYGIEWAESIGMGKYYELERIDLINGVDHLIGLGLVDGDKVGTMGWSNGAILTTELITRYPDRFKVASAGAGDVEWISDWGNVMFGATFDNYYFGSAPYENPEFYIEKSPFFRLPDVTTPTIIFHGTEDVNVPPSQSWSHYRVMQQATETPVRLILFPGEPHGLRKYVHQKRKLEEDLAWIDKYLFGKEDDDSELIAKDSPLENALKRAKAATLGQFYGVDLDGALVPETVTYKELEVGKFEVTRAQYAAFDDAFVYDPGTGNYPVTGRTFEHASAYVEWLSEEAGKAFRLPTLKEMEKLVGAGLDGENTLDHWAGYPVNPGDAGVLRDKLEDIGAPGALLHPVGRFTPVGEESVFDLDGNAAEWVVDDEGEGVPFGGSADMPKDDEGLDLSPGSTYRGFRVVVVR